MIALNINQHLKISELLISNTYAKNRPDKGKVSQLSVSKRHLHHIKGTLDAPLANCTVKVYRCSPWVMK